MAQCKILLDTNSYFRLARSIHPLLFVEFGDECYCLYVVNELQVEFNRNSRLQTKFHWVNEPQYSQNRSKKITLSKKEVKDIGISFSYISDYADSHKIGVSTVDIRAIALCYVLQILLVTDDEDMIIVANEFGVEAIKTLKLLKLMLDSGHIMMRKIREIGEYWGYDNDRPKDFYKDFLKIFGEVYRKRR